jgi:hypothetical protein
MRMFEDFHLTKTAAYYTNLVSYTSKTFEKKFLV